MNETWKYQRADVYLINFEENVGSEQGGIRPALVIQNNTGNLYAPTLIVAPITTRIRKNQKLPIHCRMDSIAYLTEPSVVMLEQIKTVDKSRVIKYLGKVTPEQMKAVDRAITISLGLDTSEE